MKSKSARILAFAVLSSAVGCIHVSTESEIKPIHITMDVNLKVDRELEKQFDNDRKSRHAGDIRIVRDLIARQAAGVDRLSMLVAREKATATDRALVDELNGRRLETFKSIARDNNMTLEAVQKRYASRMREKMTAGAWYQEDGGTWRQK